MNKNKETISNDQEDGQPKGKLKVLQVRMTVQHYFILQQRAAKSNMRLVDFTRKLLNDSLKDNV